MSATGLLASALTASKGQGRQGANKLLIALASTACVFATGAILTSQGWTVLEIRAPPLFAVALTSVLLPDGILVSRGTIADLQVRSVNSRASLQHF